MLSVDRRTKAGANSRVGRAGQGEARSVNHVVVKQNAIWKDTIFNYIHTRFIQQK